MSNGVTPIKVTRRIQASASRIFELLADPRRHPDIDGSFEFTGEAKMLQSAVSDELITGVGDVFAMKMYLDDVGDYVMLNRVVEYVPERRIGWEPAPGDVAASEDGKYPIGVPSGHRWSFELTPVDADTTDVTEIYDGASAPEDVRAATEEGEVWIDTMTATLTRLAEICEG
ncbi:MAG: hypothetical protein WA359_08530 [Acidimicrobiales bacterium]